MAKYFPQQPTDLHSNHAHIQYFLPVSTLIFMNINFFYHISKVLGPIFILNLYFEVSVAMVKFLEYSPGITKICDICDFILLYGIMFTITQVMHPYILPWEGISQILTCLVPQQPYILHSNTILALLKLLLQNIIDLV